MSNRRVRLGVVQAAPVFLERDASIAKACRYIAEAGREGLDLVAFPEGFVPAHPVWYHFHAVTSKESLSMAQRLFENAVEVPSEQTDRLCDAAAEAGVNVVIGICERKVGSPGTLYNTQLFIDRAGSIVGKHQKIMPTVGERIVHAWGWGDTLQVYPMDVGRVSGLICGENSNPLAIFAMAAQGAEVHVASWPNHFSKNEHSMADVVLLAGRALAYRANCFVLNACGTVSEEMLDILPAGDEDVRFLQDPSKSGGSSIIGANAEVLAGPMPGDQEGILAAEVDLSDCIHSKLVHDYAGHYNRPDIFTLRIDRRVPAYLEEVER